MWIIKKTCYVIFCKHHHTNIATEIKPTKTKPSTRCFFGLSRKQRGLLDARVESPHVRWRLAMNASGCYGGIQPAKGTFTFEKL